MIIINIIKRLVKKLKIKQSNKDSSCITVKNNNLKEQDIDNNNDYSKLTLDRKTVIILNTHLKKIQVDIENQVKEYESNPEKLSTYDDLSILYQYLSISYSHMIKIHGEVMFALFKDEDYQKSLKEKTHPKIIGIP